jgi:tetratricopeptide (TPR) repeat protein
LWSQGRIEEAVTTLRDAVARDPQNHALKSAYEHQRELALAHLSIAADRARGARDIEQARSLYQAALRLDPQYPRALDGLTQIEAQARQDALVEQARKLLESGDSAAAQARLDEVLAQNAGHLQARRLLQQLRDARSRRSRSRPRRR